VNVIIYEDEGYKNFLPLTWTRPVYGLRCGINTLAEKIARAYPKARIEYGCRYYLPGEKVMKFTRGLFINGRVLAHSRLAKDIPVKGKDEIFYSGDEIVAVRAVTRDFESVKKKAKIKRVNVRVIKFPWDLLLENGSQILIDKKKLKTKGKGKLHRSVAVYNPKEVIVAPGAEIEANAVLDARQGPIYIGKGTIVKAGATLRGPLSIGAECRVNGELIASIFQGYSNKGHFGFLGHSYVGEWVNLGAGTTNSNLKNTYGTINVELNGKTINSGQRFFGCLIGDHAKLGIGSLITTGAVIGAGANVLGGGVTPKSVPSFYWDKGKRYDLNKFLASARIMMSRRNRKLSEAEVALIRKIHELTQ
jgi:UDP-N-acetylglucosamine diphosphorylase/glucosamine-1-phosphate N-acetyltransferase